MSTSQNHTYACPEPKDDLDLVVTMSCSSGALILVSRVELYQNHTYGSQDLVMLVLVDDMSRSNGVLNVMLSHRASTEPYVRFPKAYV